MGTGLVTRGVLGAVTITAARRMPTGTHKSGRRRRKGRRGELHCSRRPTSSAAGAWAAACRCRRGERSTQSRTAAARAGTDTTRVTTPCLTGRRWTRTSRLAPSVTCTEPLGHRRLFLCRLVFYFFRSVCASLVLMSCVFFLPCCLVCRCVLSSFFNHIVAICSSRHASPLRCHPRTEHQSGRENWTPLSPRRGSRQGPLWRVHKRALARPYGTRADTPRRRCHDHACRPRARAAATATRPAASAATPRSPLPRRPRGCGRARRPAGGWYPPSRRPRPA